MVTANYDSRVFPILTWRDLEETLSDGAASPTQKAMVKHLIEGVRKQARFLTPIGVMREVSIIILAVTDNLPDAGPTSKPP